MICKNCRSNKIKTRRNYPHGQKSKAVVSSVCKMCGSSSVESSSFKKRGFRKR